MSALLRRLGVALALVDALSITLDELTHPFRPDVSGTHCRECSHPADYATHRTPDAIRDELGSAS